MKKKERKEEIRKGEKRKEGKRGLGASFKHELIRHSSAKVGVELSLGKREGHLHRWKRGRMVLGRERGTVLKGEGREGR